MKYISEKEKKKLLDELGKRNGKIDKFIGDDGAPVGHVIRAEHSKCGCVINVIVNISFNFPYCYETQSYDTILFSPLRISNYKWHSLSDLKLFGVKKTLKACATGLRSTDDLPISYAHYFGESDYDCFSEEVSRMVNKKFDEFSLCINEARSYMSCIDFQKYAPKITDKDEMMKYVFNCVKNVLKYYKNERIQIFFI